MKTHYGYVNRFAARGSSGVSGAAVGGGLMLFAAFLAVGAPTLWSEIAFPKEGHLPFSLLRS